MKKMFVFFLVCSIWRYVSLTQNNFLYTDGWVPVSSEIVNDQIKRGSIPGPTYIDTHNIQAFNTNINKVISTPDTMQTEEIFPDEFNLNAGTFESKCIPNSENNCQDENVPNNLIVSDYEYKPSNLFVQPTQNISGNKTTRRSKKIEVIDSEEYVQSQLANEYKSHSKSQDRTYEVTEEINDKKESEPKDEGYSYELPKKKVTNIGLFEILSKYKINKEDQLTNYAISRRQKALNPSQNNFPSQLVTSAPAKNSRNVYKYNNLNHLPVDPLLAVFLSNYGYYLQGMYGIQNQYNNLYGYLASNNIHNNRPFGVYKIFSDTDSSN